ncbi:GYD domain-containing protein [Candidatus Bathyarchaeota archaeon]|nr:MAG: GYD domain-containing protein [Candidatus Bathyarchaeota archaeon]
MPYYILLSNLTDEGWKAVKTKPERIKEVNRELEAFGVRVIHQYAVLGPYDFVNIVEAPNNETIAKVSIELGFRGTIKILSMAAIPIDEFIASVKKPNVL